MALPTCTDLEGCFLVPPTYPEPGCAPATSSGELKYLYIGSSELADGDTAEFTARVDNTGIAADAITRIAFIGTMPEPEQAEFQVEGGATVYGERTFTITGEFYEDGDEAYAFMRQTQCDKPVLVWPGNDSYIWGRADDWKEGISTVLRVNRVMEGADTLAKYIVTFTWKARFSPERAINPDPLTGNTVT